MAGEDAVAVLVLGGDVVKNMSTWLKLENKFYSLNGFVDQILASYTKFISSSILIYFAIKALKNANDVSLIIITSCFFILLLLIWVIIAAQHTALIFHLVRVMRIRYRKTLLKGKVIGGMAFIFLGWAMLGSIPLIFLIAESNISL